MVTCYVTAVTAFGGQVRDAVKAGNLSRTRSRTSFDVRSRTRFRVCRALAPAKFTQNLGANERALPSRTTFSCTKSDTVSLREPHRSGEARAPSCRDQAGEGCDGWGVVGDPQ